MPAIVKTGIWQGSTAAVYVIENGHRIDDLSEIKDDIEKALDDAGRIERRISSANVADNAEQEVLNSIDDPSERRRISEMLND